MRKAGRKNTNGMLYVNSKIKDVAFSLFLNAITELKAVSEMM